MEELHIPKLLIGYTEYANIACWGQYGFYPFNMHLSVLAAGAATGVYGELEHGEPILHQLLAEAGINFPILLGFGWQVEEY